MIATVAGAASHSSGSWTIHKEKIADPEMYVSKDVSSESYLGKDAEETPSALSTFYTRSRPFVRPRHSQLENERQMTRHWWLSLAAQGPGSESSLSTGRWIVTHSELRLGQADVASKAAWGSNFTRER